jgi:hypothetical protein
MRNMKPFCTTLIALTLAATATPLLATAAPAMPKPDNGIVRSDEISSQRQHERRPVRRYQARENIEAPRAYRGSSDPSLGPDGRPYRVPEYLRNQCYIDDGYGRFSACSNR